MTPNTNTTNDTLLETDFEEVDPSTVLPIVEVAIEDSLVSGSFLVSKKGKILKDTGDDLDVLNIEDEY